MRYIIIALALMACEKPQTYTCVCYSKQTPENYKKYSVSNNLAESEKYCGAMSNNQQYCQISK